MWLNEYEKLKKRYNFAVFDRKKHVKLHSTKVQTFINLAQYFNKEIDLDGIMKSLCEEPLKEIYRTLNNHNLKDGDMVSLLIGDTEFTRYSTVLYIGIIFFRNKTKEEIEIEEKAKAIKAEKARIRREKKKKEKEDQERKLYEKLKNKFEG